MRILYLHQHFSTPKGAAGIRSYQFARRLIERGHQVTMVCGSAGTADTGLTGPFQNGLRRGQVDGIDVIEIDLPYTNRVSFVKRALTFARFMGRASLIALREPYDRVFATTTPLTVGIPGILAHWLRRKPFVFEVRDLWPELPKAMGVIRNPLLIGALSMLEWLSYRCADRLVGLSPGIVDGIASRGISRDRIALIPNGCDIEIFGSDETPWRPAGIEPSDLLAIFSGAHGLANGLDAVLDAAATLKERGRDDIKLLLVGDGMQKAALQARAAREGLSNVVFHSPVPKSKLVGLFAASDIGLQILANIPAFYFGTSPNKFFDYISAGLPVLTNYPGWLADMIRENDCGFAVPPEAPHAMADAFEQAASDRGALAHQGERALALAQTQFDRNDLADQWVNWVAA